MVALHWQSGLVVRSAFGVAYRKIQDVESAPLAPSLTWSYSPPLSGWKPGLAFSTAVDDNRSYRLGMVDRLSGPAVPTSYPRPNPRLGGRKVPSGSFLFQSSLSRNRGLFRAVVSEGQSGAKHLDRVE